MNGNAPVTTAQNNARAAVRAQEALAATLALVAGFVDAYGLITYHTYVSFMSGNTTQTGSGVGAGKFAVAVPSGIAVASFVAGSFAGCLIAKAPIRRLRSALFGLVAALLALAIAFTELGLDFAALYIAMISFAMGAINNVLSKIGDESVSLTFVTGTLSRLGMHLALAVRCAPVADSHGPWDTHRHRALLLGGIWSAFIAGAFLSGAATPHFGVWALLFPIFIVLTLITLNHAPGFWAGPVAPNVSGSPKCHGHARRAIIRGRKT